MSSPSTQSDVDSKLELHLNIPRPSSWERYLLSECLCIAVQSAAAPSHVYELDVMPSISQQALQYECAVVYGHTCSSPPVYIWFPLGCFAPCGEAVAYFPPAAIILQQCVRQVGCQVRPCRAAISLLGLLPGWLIDWVEALFSICTWLPTVCYITVFCFCSGSV